MRLKVLQVTHPRPCSYEHFWPLFIYESSSFIPCHAWFVFLASLLPLFWMMRLLADSAGQLNAKLRENSGGVHQHPILGIYEAEHLLAVWLPGKPSAPGISCVSIRQTS